MTNLLVEAEALEKAAAAERVEYYTPLLSSSIGNADPFLLLDVGCGNGYSIPDWRRHSFKAFGVDISFYRLTRWVHDHPPAPALVLADSRRLPFRPATFDAVISSGMIEHVGVDEMSNPYRITARPSRQWRASASTGRRYRLISH